MPGCEPHREQLSGLLSARRRRPPRQRMASWQRAPAQHAVAEREEPILRVEGMRIRASPALITDKSRKEHEQRRARLVKVGEQPVDGAKAMSGMDEEARRAGLGAERPV